MPEGVSLDRYHLRECCNILKGTCLGFLGNKVLGHRDDLLEAGRLATNTTKGEDFVTWLEGCDEIAHFLDYTGGVETEGCRPVLYHLPAGHHLPVQGVECHGFDTNAYIGRLGCGLGHRCKRKGTALLRCLVLQHRIGHRGLRREAGERAK